MVDNIKTQKGRNLETLMTAYNLMYGKRNELTYSKLMRQSNEWKYYFFNFDCQCIDGFMDIDKTYAERAIALHDFMHNTGWDQRNYRIARDLRDVAWGW